jgi:hypothetical protein
MTPRLRASATNCENRYGGLVNRAGWLVVVSVVIACSSPSDGPRQARIARAGTADAALPLLRVPRPSLDLPKPFLDPLTTRDLDPDDARWPLARDPAIEPHADLVAMFRTSSSWRSLCTARGEPRGVDRDEAVLYVEAWCTVETDRARSLDHLAKLAASAKSRALATAARADLVDLLAASPQPASDVMRTLRSQRLDDIDQLDALAATYQALDKHADAAAVAIVLRERKGAGQPADICRRALRDHVLTRRDIRSELRGSNDPTCERIARIVRGLAPRCPLLSQNWPADVCAKPGCGPIIDELLICYALPSHDEPAILLLAIYQNWPTKEPRARVWTEYARFTHQLLAQKGALDLLGAALENASLVANCATELAPIVELARSAVDRGFTSRALVHVARLTETTCADRFSPTLGRRLR